MRVHEIALDHLGTVSRGRSRHRPRDAPHLYGGRYPFVQTGDVKRAGLYLRDYEQTYSDAGLAQSKLWPVGTLCITIAANIAETSILDIEACFPDSVIGFLADEDKADTRFIKYLFDAVMTTRIRSFTQGAAQDNLSQAKLLSLRFPVPDVAIQRRIANILSAYDDLIENNRRRISLLEETARLLYEEWFVRFRFPGHERITTTDGMPCGWKHTTIEAHATLVRGTSYRSKELVASGGKPFVNLKSIARHGGFRLEGLKRFSGQFKSSQVVTPGDIVIGLTDMTRERHIVAHAARIPTVIVEDAVCSMDVAKISPDDSMDKLWFYCFLRYSPFSKEVRESATGTNVLHLKAK